MIFGFLIFVGALLATLDVRAGSSSALSSGLDKAFVDSAGSAEPKPATDDDLIDQILRAVLKQQQQWKNESSSSPLYHYHGLVQTMNATVAALLGHGPSGGDDWLASFTKVAKIFLPLAGLPGVDEGATIVATIAGSVLSFLGIFGGGKSEAEQLRKELVKSLPKIMAQEYADEELSKGSDKAGELAATFSDEAFVSIVQGTGSSYLDTIEALCTANRASIFGASCVDCTSGACKWTKETSTACKDYSAAGPITFQYSFVLLHLIVILESAKQAPAERQTPAFLQAALEHVIEQAAEYGSLLEKSMNTWKDHGLDALHCEYGDFTCDDTFFPCDGTSPIINFKANLKNDKHVKTTQFGISVPDATGCRTLFGMQESKFDKPAYKPNPSDKPCQYNDGFHCSDDTYTDYKKTWQGDVLTAWKSLVDFVKDISTLKPAPAPPPSPLPTPSPSAPIPTPSPSSPCAGEVAAGEDCMEPGWTQQKCCPDGYECVFWVGSLYANCQSSSLAYHLRR